VFVDFALFLEIHYKLNKRWANQDPIRNAWQTDRQARQA
jgi:hypothetical protein